MYLFEPKFALLRLKINCTGHDEDIVKVLRFYTSSNMAISEYSAVDLLVVAFFSK